MKRCRLAARRSTSLNLCYLLAAALCGYLTWPASACPCNQIEAPSQADPDTNLRAGIRFSHSLEYDRQLKAALDSARDATLRYIGKKNVAVVSDIDETLLDNRSELKGHFAALDWIKFFVWVEEARAPLIQPTANLLAWARQKGFAIFLITGRRERYRRATVENLLSQGVCYDGLFMRADDDHNRAAVSKTAHRKAIEQMGFHIVVNIGDQWSDLAGGHAEDCEKLPNRMYFVP